MRAIVRQSWVVFMPQKLERKKSVTSGLLFVDLAQSVFAFEVGLPLCTIHALKIEPPVQLPAMSSSSSEDSEDGHLLDVSNSESKESGQASAAWESVYVRLSPTP